MAIRLPMNPARRLFYTPITVYTTLPGKWVDGEYEDGEVVERVIAGSFQPPAPLRQDINAAGLVGLGERSLWTTADLPYYDLDSSVQSWVVREGRKWYLTDRHVWDGHVSRNLFVYALERYHKTDATGEFPAPPDPEPEP